MESSTVTDLDAKHPGLTNDLTEPGTAGPRRGPIRWYRTAVSPEDLRALQQRSDLLGGLQAGGYLALLILTGTLAYFSCGRAAWWVTLLLTFGHGTCFAFQINPVHELCHGTVFRTPVLNEIFKRLFSFIGWINFPMFSKGHATHHRFTLHPPHDLEVTLPIRIRLRQFFLKAFVNPTYGEGIWAIGEALRIARGRFQGDAELTLFPAGDPDRRRPIRWARALLAGHALLVAVAVAAALMGHPRFLMIPVLITFGQWYGGWLFFLCNNSQHIGLRNDVADFRLCSRTIELNPVVQFLYWHMNFHIEHHMYTQVPCYRLGRLHRLIERDLPPSPRGLVQTWRQIAAIQARQDDDPHYQYHATCPGPSRHTEAHVFVP